MPTEREALEYALTCCEEWLSEYPMPVEQGLVLADDTHQAFLAIRSQAMLALGRPEPYLTPARFIQFLPGRWLTKAFLECLASRCARMRRRMSL